MSRPNFMVLVQGGTDAGRERVTEALRNLGYGFWHLHRDTWFIVAGGTIPDCRGLVSWLRQVSQEEAYWLVVRGDSSGEWAAYGPLDAYKWFEQSWHGNPFEKLAQSSLFK